MLKNNKNIFSLYFIYGSVFLVVLAMIITLLFFAQKQKDYSVLINLAGRQRALSQVLLKDVFIFETKNKKKQDISKTIRVFERTMHSFIHGGNVQVSLNSDAYRHIPRIESDNIQKLMSGIQNNWNLYKEKIHLYLENSAPVDAVALSKMSNSLLLSIDNAVLALQHESEQYNYYMRMILTISIIVISCILGVSLFFYVKQLNSAAEHIENLEKILPICSNCKNIRKDDEPDEAKKWVPIEAYLREKNDMLFSHGLCDSCAKKLYPEIYEKIKDKDNHST